MNPEQQQAYTITKAAVDAAQQKQVDSLVETLVNMTMRALTAESKLAALLNANAEGKVA